MEGGRWFTACVLASSLLVGCSERTGSDTHEARRFVRDRVVARSFVSNLWQSSTMCFTAETIATSDQWKLSDSTQIGGIIDTLSLRSAKEYSGPDFAMGANTIIEVVIFQKGKETGRFEILGNMLYVQIRGKKHELRLESADAWLKLGDFARPINSREMPKLGSEDD